MSGVTLARPGTSPTKVAFRSGLPTPVAPAGRAFRVNQLGAHFAQAVGVRIGVGFRWAMSRVKRAAAGAALLPLVSAAACGGRYEDPGNQKPGTGDPAPTSGSSPSHTGSSDSLPTHPLGACVPGFDRSSDPSRPCQWVTEKGECFDSFDAACACVCPTSGNSLCSGSFSPNISGETVVYCDKT